MRRWAIAEPRRVSGRTGSKIKYAVSRTRWRTRSEPILYKRIDDCRSDGTRICSIVFTYFISYLTPRDTDADYWLQNFTDQMVDFQSSSGRLLILRFKESEIIRGSVMRYVRYFLYFMIFVTVSYYISMYLTYDKKPLMMGLSFFIQLAVVFSLLYFERFLIRRTKKKETV